MLADVTDRAWPGSAGVCASTTSAARPGKQKRRQAAPGYAVSLALAVVDAASAWRKT
ncbi:hypothetical protein [Rhodanobacter lindaniclasticus]